AQVTVRPLAAVGELGARRLELHVHVVGGTVQKLALLGQDQPARMAVKQRNAQLLFERGNLARDGGLRQSELLAGMGETARLGRGVKDLELVPVHEIVTTADDGGRKSKNARANSLSVLCRPSSVLCYSAATRGS